MIWVAHRRKAAHAKLHFSNNENAKKAEPFSLPRFHLVLPPRAAAPPPLLAPQRPLLLRRALLPSTSSSRPTTPPHGPQIPTAVAPQAHPQQRPLDPDGGGSPRSRPVATPRSRRPWLPPSSRPVASPRCSLSFVHLLHSSCGSLEDLGCGRPAPPQTRLTAGRAPPRRLLWGHHYGVAEICVFQREDAYLRSLWPRTQNGCLVWVFCWILFLGCKTLCMTYFCVWVPLLETV